MTVRPAVVGLIVLVTASGGGASSGAQDAAPSHPMKVTGMVAVADAGGGTTVYVTDGETPAFGFKDLVLTSVDLDYALLRLKRPADRDPLRLKAVAVAENQPLLVIEHPAGETKQVSILDCRVDQAEIEGLSDVKTDFGHRCDTLGGSSGSPIQDVTTGDVVGLHHLGLKPGVPFPVNQGVRIGLILDDIRSRRPDLMPEIVAAVR